MQGDKAAAGFGVVFHWGVEGDVVAGAVGAEDEVGEGQVFEGSALGFAGADAAVGLEV